MLPFADFLKVFSIVLRLTIRFFNETGVKHKAERRALLEKKKEHEYQLMCQRQMTMQAVLRQEISTQVCREFQVNPQSYQMSAVFY